MIDMGQRSTSIVIIVAVMLMFGCTAQGVGPMPIVTGGLKFSKTVTTWKDIRQKNVIMQNNDYSCGAASLATLFTYYFNDPITEHKIIIDMLDVLPESQRMDRIKTGFSLLDLKNFAIRRGYSAVGAKLKLHDLLKLRGPVLVYLETPDFKHFAILRGVREDRIVLADPSRGNVQMLVDKFAEEWPGIILALGKEGFGTPENHALSVPKDDTVRNELNSVRAALYR